MSNLLLMAALVTSTNAPECCWFRCGPYPAWYAGCYYPWYYSPWYPPYPCGWYPYGPVCVVQESGQAQQQKRTPAPKNEEKQDLQKGVGKDKSEKKTSLGNQALLVVELPTDATLFIDDNPTKSTSARRAIITPPLNASRPYYYEVRAEVVRNGQKLVETQQVLLHAGQESHVRFTDLTARAAVVAETASR